jgi:hypothetical protein
VAAQTDDVATLLATTRSLVNQAHRLASSIDSTVEELQEFHDDLVRPDRERRVRQQPYEGDDRRA